MRSDDAEEAAQTVQRLNDAGEQRGVAAIAREDLSDSELETADRLFGFLAFLIGHVGSPPERLSVLFTSRANRRFSSSVSAERGCQLRDRQLWHRIGTRRVFRDHRRSYHVVSRERCNHLLLHFGHRMGTGQHIRLAFQRDSEYALHPVVCLRVTARQEDRGQQKRTCNADEIKGVEVITEMLESGLIGRASRADARHGRAGRLPTLWP